MSKFVYILSDHDEYGAENIQATLDPGCLPHMLEAYLSLIADEKNRQSLRDESLPELNKLLSLPPKEGTYKLASGWGGVRIDIVRLIGEKQWLRMGSSGIEECTEEQSDAYNRSIGVSEDEIQRGKRN